LKALESDFSVSIPTEIERVKQEIENIKETSTTDDVPSGATS
jgi:hypothetical protein